MNHAALLTSMVLSYLWKLAGVWELRARSRIMKANGNPMQ